MAEEFQAGVCGESWWNYSTSFGNSSVCASSIHDPIGHDFAWPISDLLDMKDKSSDESCSDDSMVLKHDHLLDSFSSTPVNLSMDYSTLQMWEIGLSSTSSTPDWNQSPVSHDKLDSNYPSMLQEDNTNSRLNYRQEKGLIPELKRNFSSITEDSSSNSFKPINQDFALGLQPFNPVTISRTTTESTVTCQRQNSSFAYSSDLLQTLFDTDPQQPQQSLFDNNKPINYASSTNYRQNLNNFAPSLPRYPDLLKSSLLKQTPSNHITSSKSNIEDIQESTTNSLTENRSNEPSYKRPRIETPSALPTFKVRKEKMGDRITALQQLVSPFGKTDTASVLQEAIEYIKFLHDQVNVLSTPYVKNGSPTQRQQVKEQGLKQELRRRGLCLVPMSSTFPAVAETMDFWTPALGGYSDSETTQRRED